MMIVLRIALGMLLLGVALIIAALIANRVPLTAPPGLALRLKTYLTSHYVATAPDSVFPELRSADYPLAPDVLYAAARAGVAALGWSVVSEDLKQRHLHAVVSSRLWRFKDDVQITVTATADGARLDASAQSRVGRGDLGANLRHILDLKAALRARLINPRR